MLNGEFAQRAGRQAGRARDRAKRATSRGSKSPARCELALGRPATDDEIAEGLALARTTATRTRPDAERARCGTGALTVFNLNEFVYLGLRS